MLQLARDEGIVHIEIRRPSSPERLSEELRSALGLRRVVVVPASSRSGLHVLVAPAVEEIARLALAPGDAMAVSWGSTIEEIARSRQFPPLHGVHLIPAIAAFDEIDARFQTNEIARRIAAAEPARTSTSCTRRPCRRRGCAGRSWRTRSRAAGWRSGTGSRPRSSASGRRPPRSRPRPAHVLAARDDLVHAVGDVASRYFDIDGRPVAFEDEKLLLGRVPRPAAQHRHRDRRGGREPPRDPRSSGRRARG